MIVLNLLRFTHRVCLDPILNAEGPCSFIPLPLRPREEARARRDFLKRAAAVGVAAPAVMLLLSVKPAQAQPNGYETPD